MHMSRQPPAHTAESSHFDTTDPCARYPLSAARADEHVRVGVRLLRVSENKNSAACCVDNHTSRRARVYFVIKLLVWVGNWLTFCKWSNGRAGPWSSMYWLRGLGRGGCHYFDYLRIAYKNASLHGGNSSKFTALKERKSREGTQNS